MVDVRAQVITLLRNNEIQGSKKGNSYSCLHVDLNCIVFDSNTKSKKVMIPMDVAAEWIEAYISRQIYPEWNSRLKRDTITEHSTWSTTLHSFESHLNAILQAYIGNYE